MNKSQIQNINAKVMQELDGLNERMIKMCPNLTEIPLSERTHLQGELSKLRQAVQCVLVHDEPIPLEELAGMVEDVRIRLDNLKDV